MSDIIIETIDDLDSFLNSGYIIDLNTNSLCKNITDWFGNIISYNVPVSSELSIQLILRKAFS